ncbi:MAG: type II secretion system F family protein [Planctomycetota bacterium]|nr:type II secretion system F family protein [Planctomycetota bacterium]
MNHFKYAAKSPQGEHVEGTISATNKAEALAELRSKNLILLRLDEAGGVGRAGGRWSFGKRKPTIKAGKGELVIFTRQLATMVGAGLSLLESLEVLGQQAESPGMKAACESMVADLRGGSDLSQAMERCPRVFSHLYANMVKAGEVSGQMDVILERLADYQEQSEALSREIRSAMTYPVISMILVLGITAFLMVGVVPTFKEVFESMDAELPAITAFVLELSRILRENAGVILLSLIALSGSLVMITRTNKGAYHWDRLRLKVPVFGTLTKKVCLARFSRTFSTLIRSGVPIMSTLDIVGHTAGNRVVSRAVMKARESVRNGNLLSEPLASEPVFPPMVVRMIAIGERTGALEALLEKIAEFYDAQVKAQVKALTSLIEPILISVMGLVVGTVVLSIFIPILDMAGKAGS